MRKKRSAVADDDDDGDALEKNHKQQQQSTPAVPPTTLPTSTRASSSRQPSRWKHAEKEKQERWRSFFLYASPSSLSLFFCFVFFLEFFFRKWKASRSKRATRAKNEEKKRK